MTAKCEACGQEYAIGEWPYCPHGVPAKGTQSPFIARYDFSGGEYTSSLGDRRQMMKRKGLDYSPIGVGMPGCEV